MSDMSSLKRISIQDSQPMEFSPGISNWGSDTWTLSSVALMLHVHRRFSNFSKISRPDLSLFFIFCRLFVLSLDSEMKLDYSLYK